MNSVAESKGRGLRVNFALVAVILVFYSYVLNYALCCAVLCCVVLYCGV